MVCHYCVGHLLLHCHLSHCLRSIKNPVPVESNFCRNLCRNSRKGKCRTVPVFKLALRCCSSSVFAGALESTRALKSQTSNSQCGCRLVRPGGVSNGCLSRYMVREDLTGRPLLGSNVPAAPAHRRGTGRLPTFPLLNLLPAYAGRRLSSEKVMRPWSPSRRTAVASGTPVGHPGVPTSCVGSQMYSPSPTVQMTLRSRLNSGKASSRPKARRFFC